VLGLGDGQTVTLQPPETAPAAFYPADDTDPEAGSPNLQTIAINPLERLPLTGYGAIIPTREIVTGATYLNRGVIGANGSIDFQGGFLGDGDLHPDVLDPSVGEVVARGNITVSGPIYFRAEDLVAFLSLGSISLLGTP
jgi:hypothetical protein